MDTRGKIDPEHIPADARSLPLVIGTFDPFYAAHATRLNELAGPEGLAVALDSLPDSLVSVRARAEVVAGLSVVRYVFTSVEQALQALDPARVFDERAADRERTAALKRRIVERSHAK